MVDFIVTDLGHNILIQVCYSLADKKTLQRETRSLVKVMNDLNVKESLLLTYNEEDTFNIGGLGG